VGRSAAGAHVAGADRQESAAQTSFVLWKRTIWRRKTHPGRLRRRHVARRLTWRNGRAPRRFDTPAHRDNVAHPRIGLSFEPLRTPQWEVPHRK
jgi:hypothetical protein